MYLITVVLAITIGGSFACANKTEEQINIGAIYPLSGSWAATGTDIKNGVVMAADIINNEYDLDMPLAKSKGIPSLNGVKVNIIFGDSQGYPATGKSQAERLIGEENVVALMGCYQSAVTADTSLAAEEKGIPFMTAMSSAPSLTERGLYWFFRCAPNDDTFFQNFYQFLGDIKSKGKDVGKIGIVNENSLWGSEFAEFGKQYAGEYGYTISEMVSYSATSTDVTSEVQLLKDANINVVMQASYVNDAILYMKTYKEMNFNPDAILADDGGFVEPEFLKVLGDNGNYILTRATWSADLAEVKPLAGTINHMFRERYGADMNDNSARAFTGMIVLADAIDRAGSTSPAKIREALLKTDIPGDKLIMPWDGVSFDRETHQNTMAKGIICQVINQKYYTVWPWNLATKELICPKPEWEK
jgi:branched-chain amino acid transport system substrate-binding protein